MSRITDQETLLALTPLIDDAKRFQQQLSPLREKFNGMYKAEAYGNERPGWSQTVAPVIYDVVEWLKPYLYEIFTGDFFSMTGQNKPAAQKLKDYLRFKLFTQQDTETEIDDFLHYCLTSFYGVLKVTQKNDYKDRNTEFEVLSEQQFQQLSALPDIEVSKYEEEETLDPLSGGSTFSYKNVKVQYIETAYKGPSIENVPPTEFYMSQGYRKLADCPLVAHVVTRTLDYVKRRETEGIYTKGSHKKVLDKIIARFNSNEETQSEIAALFAGNGMEVPEQVNYTHEMVLANAPVELWECYCKLDIDKDGFIEESVTTLCEDIILQPPIENEYGSAPFVLGGIFRQPDSILNRPIPEIMDDWQRVLTNLQRSIQDSAIISSKRGFMTTSRRTQAALRRWQPGDTAVVDSMEGAKQIDFGAPTQFIMKTYEMVNAEKDKNSGVNEAMMGLDRDAQNRTAKGMAMKLTASQSRQKLYARRLSRSFKEALRRVVDCLRLYEPEDDVDVVGEEIQVTKEDLRGEYFVQIDVGSGPQDSQQRAQIMDSHLQFLLQVGLQAGFAKPEHVLRTVTRKFDYLDIDMSDLMLTEEEFNAEQQRKRQLAQQQQQGPRGVPQPGAGPQGMPGQPPVQRGGGPPVRPMGRPNPSPQPIIKR